MYNKNDKHLILSSLSKTWIVDLDGTIVKHNGYIIDGKDTLLPNSKEFLEKIPESDMIIFLTSRSQNLSKQTESFLKQEKIRYDHIIYDAPFGERILINDNKPSGLIMAHAICVDRNSGVNCYIEIDEKI